MSAEKRFNAQDFAKMALERDHFRVRMPRIVHRIVDAFGFDAPTHIIESQPLEQMLGNVRTLWNDGSRRLLLGVYGDFCRDNGILVARDSEMFGTMHVPPDLEELNASEASKWNSYMTQGDIPRDIVVGVMQRNFGFMFPGSLPSIRYQADERVVALYHVVESIPYKVVATIFPDLTDDEAKKFFGQLTTADEVFRKAETIPVSGELTPPSIE